MAKGLDTADIISASKATALKATGYEFAGRYFSYSNWKNLGSGEAKDLSGAGLYIVSIFEADPTAGAYFTIQQAQDDAARSLMMAKQVGQPPSTPIYFTVDYDAVSSADLASITSYFSTLRTAVVSTGGYAMGAYGSGLILSVLHSAGLIEFTYLAQSAGWAGSADFTGANIIQQSETTVLGIDIDVDQSNGNGGGWRI